MGSQFDDEKNANQLKVFPMNKNKEPLKTTFSKKRYTNDDVAGGGI